MTRDERGITVVELLVVLGITGLITGILVTAIYQVYQVTGWGNSTLVVQHDLQNAATWLNRDVLTASEAEVSGSQMVLTVPYSISVDTVLTHTITYTYSEADGTLTRDSDDSSLIVARHVYSDPFPLTDTIEAPDPVTVTLSSEKGDVPGSGTFALKMRAGGSTQVVAPCQITGAGSLGFDGSKVSWNITNNGQTSPSIDEIYITWPITNQTLSMINFGSIPIYAVPKEPPSVTISGPWQGNCEIISGTQKTLEFNFELDAVNNEDLYSIEITFDNGCIVP